MSTTAHPSVHPGLRSIRAGTAMVVVAALVIAGSIVAWLVFGGPSGDDAVVFEMPGSVTADLTQGEWALYSEEVDGQQKVAYHDQVGIDGPGEVSAEETFGFYSDTTTIKVDGTTYNVFLRLDVPTDGSYEVTVADGATDPGTPVVLGHYDDDDTLAWLVILGVLGGMALGAAGLVTAIVGLVLRARGRRPAAA